MSKKILSNIIEFFQEEYKFLVITILIFATLQFPLNYYVIVGGGVSDVSSRIEVEEKNKSKGSFNISYVTELEGTVSTVLLSYIIPTWDREDANLYKYEETESLEDIEFRSDLELTSASSKATYWAYTLANKELKELDSKLFVIANFKEYKTPLKIGDEILSIDNHSYKTVEEYREYLNTKKEKDTVLVKVKRNNQEKEVEATLYSYKERTILGVSLQGYTEYETNPKVEIQFKRSESGPSGGLITTLEIYNQLTKKDLTKGLKIAGTGTIEEDGTIGTIGGVTYKLLGAEKAKADIFLVPSGQNYKDALKYKKSKKLKIKLIEVKSIEDAIEKLERN